MTCTRCRVGRAKWRGKCCACRDAMTRRERIEERLVVRAANRLPSDSDLSRDALRTPDYQWLCRYQESTR